MEVRLTLQKFTEIGSHGFPRVSCYGHRGEQVDNGRKWPKMDFRVFPVMVIEVEKRRSGKNGGKWSKMVENGLPRENGRKWISAYFTSFPYY